MVQLPAGVRARANYGILAFGAFTYLLQNFVWFSFPALLPELIEDIRLTSTQAGILNGTIPLIYIFLSIGIGVAIDRFGGRLGIGIALFLFGTGQLLRSFAGGFWGLFVTTVVIGIGAALISMALPKIVAAYFPANRSGSMSSGYLLGAQVGSAVAFLLARPYLSPLLGDWRAVFFWSGLFVIGTAFVWLPTIDHLQTLHILGRAANEGDGGGEQRDENAETELRRDLQMLLTHRDLQLLVVIGTMLLALTHGLRGWLPVILERGGFSASAAASVVTVLVVGQIGGVLTIPPLSDRFGRRRVAITGCGTLTTLGMVGILYTQTTLLTGAAVFVVGVGLGGVSPLVRALPIELDAVGPRLTGTAVGLIFTVGEVGGFLAPFLIGLFEDFYGSFTPGIVFLGGCAVVLLTAGVLMDEPSVGANAER